MYKKLLALATFSGTIIGVGLFGLPFVTAKVGFLPMVIYFLILGGFIITIQLMYGEISLRTKNNHRLPGYASIFLNKKAAAVSYLSTFIGLTGSLLAYIIVGGEFLTNFLSPYLGGTQFFYSSLFFIVGAVIIYFGTGSVSKTEFFSIGLFFAILLVLLVKAAPHIQFQFFLENNVAQHFFLPYGVILFSLGGMAVIPEMREILGKHERSLLPIIVIGTLIPMVTYLLFIVIIFGVTGAATTPEGLLGFNRVTGGGVAHLGYLFGIIATFTSFLTLGITLKKEFQYDRGLPAPIAWGIAVMPAYAAYLIGISDFIGIIGFIGSVMLGIDTIMIIAIYLRARKQSQRIPAYQLNISFPLSLIIITIFMIGIGLEIYSLLK